MLMVPEPTSILSPLLWGSSLPLKTVLLGAAACPGDSPVTRAALQVPAASTKNLGGVKQCQVPAAQLTKYILRVIHQEKKRNTEL